MVISTSGQLLYAQTIIDTKPGIIAFRPVTGPRLPPQCSLICCNKDCWLIKAVFFQNLSPVTGYSETRTASASFQIFCLILGRSKRFATTRIFRKILESFGARIKLQMSLLSRGSPPATDWNHYENDQQRPLIVRKTALESSEKLCRNRTQSF